MCADIFCNIARWTFSQKLKIKELAVDILIQTLLLKSSGLEVGLETILSEHSITRFTSKQLKINVYLFFHSSMADGLGVYSS